MIFKDDIIENSNMIDLLTWMIKLRSSNTNHISPFVSLVFAKAIAECHVALEQIKNKDMMTMVKMVKETDKEFIQDTPITSRKLLERPKDETKSEKFKPYKRPRKTKKIISSMEMKKNEVERIFKKNTSFTSIL